MAVVLGLEDKISRIPVSFIASFGANTDTEAAYEQFCKDLSQIGVTKATIYQKGNEILTILKSRGIADSQLLVLLHELFLYIFSH